MEMLDATAVLLSVAAIFGYINLKVFKLPTAIGIMLIGLVLSILLLCLQGVVPSWTGRVDAFVEGIDFSQALMQGMLSYLLFAGALHVNLHDLKSQVRVVSWLATVGVVGSTFLIGSASWLLFPLFGFDVPYLWCLVFGALITPTDPVAVLGILKKVGAPKSLETKITGESLFNDGVGVVVYIAVLGLAMGGHGHGGGHEETMGAGEILKLFAIEAGGGVAWGVALGGLAYVALRSINNYQVEVLITLALVTAGYRLASEWHISGPLAMVVAGLMIGNHGRESAMSERTRESVDLFWELVDEILNAVLFLLIALELFVLKVTGPAVGAGLVLIAVVLAARFVSVVVPVSILKPFRTFTPGVIRILTWGGIRGGISVALALGIPKVAGQESAREAILVATYVVVVFSILVQGLSLKPLVARVVRQREAETAS